MRFKAVFIALTILFPVIAVACLNEYGTSVAGVARLRINSVVPPVIPIDIEYYRMRMEVLSPRIADSTDHAIFSDLAVAHLYLGNTSRAIELLLRAEELQPNEYAVASNLGTAYEIAGDNASALQWIVEGIRRNPESHKRSEWVHENLLRAKIEMAKDPEWIRDNTITGLRFGDGDSPAYDRLSSAANCPTDLRDTRKHLEHQLIERRQFITGADPVVAAMMFDLANATVLTGTVEDAIPIYATAKALGFHDSKLVDRRIAAAQQLANSNLLSGWTYGSLGLAAFTIALLIVTGIILTIIYTHRMRKDADR